MANEWKVEHYCPHQLMVKSLKEDGALNSFVSRIVDGNGKVIADWLDHRDHRPPRDPGPAPDAELIVNLANRWNHVE